MKPADRKAFAEVVLAFAELKGKQLSAPALELYWRAMQRWTLEEFRAAAEQLVRTCKFFPTPAEFEDLRKAARMSSGEAWALVRIAARNGDPCPDDPAIRGAVAALGGIRAIGLTNTDQMPFLERRFADHFAEIQDREDVRAALPDLTGGPRLAAEVRAPLLDLVKRP